MPRYVAFLRGVSPMNAKMADVKRCFEYAGFANVKTVLSSGNVAFDAGGKSAVALARAAESAMAEQMGRSFMTIVRSTQDLRALLAADPYAGFRLPTAAKRVVTFLRAAPRAEPALPIDSDDVRILALRGREVFTAYVPNPRGPVFMTLIERTFGAELTTRTWDTVGRCAAA